MRTHDDRRTVDHKPKNSVESQFQQGRSVPASERSRDTAAYLFAVGTIAILAAMLAAAFGVI